MRLDGEDLYEAFGGIVNPSDFIEKPEGSELRFLVAATCRPATSPRSDQRPQGGRLFGVPPNAVPRRMQ